MSKKIRKKKKKIVHLPTSNVPTFCGFPINLKNYNRLWRWDTLEDYKI